MEKFTILFKNDSFEIVEVKRRCRNGKLATSWYVDFGLKNGGSDYSSICILDFETKSEFKDFIKSKNLEEHFSKMFLKT